MSDRIFNFQPGSNYIEHVDTQNICLGGTQIVYPKNARDGNDSVPAIEATPVSEDSQRDSQPSSQPLNREEALKKTLEYFRDNYKYSRTYKWGMLYQALVRKGLIRKIPIIRFGELVQKLVGVSVSTVKGDGVFYTYQKDYEPLINDLEAIIDGLSNM